MHNDLDIFWKECNGWNCLVFKFNGKLTAKNAASAIERWEKELDEYEAADARIIWECTNMTGWEPKARRMWQKTLQKNKMRIARIWVVTNSAKIKAGAQIMMTFTSYPIKTIKSIEALESYFEANPKAY